MPIGPARTGRALGPQPIDLAQEILANAPIVQARAAARRTGAVRTVRPARAERLATGRSPIVRLPRGIGRRGAEPLGALSSEEPEAVVAAPRVSPEADSALPHFVAAGDSEAEAVDSAAAEAAVVGVDRT
jgi:hypothetical protein